MCSMKTMIRIALGIGALLILGYVIFPESRASIAALAPFLLILACPLAMYYAMKATKKPPQEAEKQPDQDRK